MSKREFADVIYELQIRGRYHPMKDIKPEVLTHRYEQTGAACRLQTWGDAHFDPLNERNANEVTLLPQWARDVVSVALVSGVMRESKHPPPQYILWFETDRDHNFIRFVNESL